MALESLKKLNYLVFFICLLTSNHLSYLKAENQNYQIQPETSESTELAELRAKIDTTERIIFQSISETFWNLIKENSQSTKISVINDNNKEYKLDLAEFGKIFSNLAVDELIPMPKQNMQQKIAELLTPTAVAFLITQFVTFSKEKNYLQLSAKLGLILLIKLLMVRFFFKPGTTKYKIANLFAQIGSFYKYNQEKTGFWRYASIQNGLIKLTQDELKSLVDVSDLNETLNETHRKKAIRKIIQTLIEPYIMWTMDKACIHY